MLKEAVFRQHQSRFRFESLGRLPFSRRIRAVRRF
jgi:hypothetical protein